MRTGRPAVPPEIQRLKGDPRRKGARKLEAEAEAAAAQADQGRAETLPPPKFEVPDFLTVPREVEIFERVVRELMPPNIIRSSDFNAVGRYAVTLHEYILAKEELVKAGNSRFYLAKSQHNPDGIYRLHPAAARMDSLGIDCLKYEAMLGMTPLSRQSLLRGLQALPKGAIGGLFEEHPPVDAEPIEDAEEESPSIPPRGFLAPATQTRN